jgi:hypothetical protein
MDDGYTEHTMLEEEKWITVMWMRDGVSKDPHPSGIKSLDGTD